MVQVLHFAVMQGALVQFTDQTINQAGGLITR